MATHGDNKDGLSPAPRSDGTICRRAGCEGRSVSPEGFCPGCKDAYEQTRLARERELADTARMLGLANPQWRKTFADALPGQYELMLLHAAAHHLQYGGSAGQAVSLRALHDYLDDTMDRVRHAAGERSSERTAASADRQDTHRCRYAGSACSVALAGVVDRASVPSVLGLLARGNRRPI